MFFPLIILNKTLEGSHKMKKKVKHGQKDIKHKLDLL